MMNRSAELELAIESCRSNFRGAARHDVRGAIDWARFVQLVTFHRIEGLAYQALREHSGVPAFVCDQLAAAGTAIAARNLQMAAECRSLFGEFQSAGIPVLFVKGLTLGTLAYGNPALKSAVDIDLLIDPSDLDEADTCLRKAEFDLIAPRRSLNRWHRSWKESVWRKGTSDIQLDLHTRLADNPHLIPTLDVHAPRQMVEVGPGIVLPTLAADELATYLAVHGAASGWFRLKWIADFAALLSNRPAAGLERLHEHGQLLGAGRAMSQALLLADILFGSLAELPEFRGELRGDAAAARLVRVALAMINRAPSEPTERFLGTMPIQFSQFAARAGVSYKLAEVRRRVEQVFTRLTI